MSPKSLHWRYASPAPRFLSAGKRLSVPIYQAFRASFCARRSGYTHPETGKHYAFLTNNLKLAPKSIADIYKARWQIELFFQWVKQNLKIKSFVGTSENAVVSEA